MQARLAFKILSLLAMLCGECAAQCGPISRESPDAVRTEVRRIFNRSLDAMQVVTTSGVRATTWVPPDEQDVAQIKCLGASALPAVTEQLNSNRSFGQLLAIRMLGWIGGREIVPPLARLLKSSHSQTLKVAALEALYSAPPAEAMPVLQNTLKSDANAYVRKKAAEIISRYG